MKALIDEVEDHAKKRKAQAEIEKINDLKAKKETIEKKWKQHLKTAGEAALALKIKGDIEADLAKLRGSIQEVATRLQSQPDTN